MASAKQAIPVHDWREKSLAEIDAEELRLSFISGCYWQPVSIMSGVDLAEEKWKQSYLQRVRANIREMNKREPGIKWACIAVMSFGVTAYAWH